MDYVEATMVDCPRCGVRTGSRCRNEYHDYRDRDCDCVICSYLAAVLPEPHLERAMAARKAGGHLT